jgi:hypothetical protein
VQPNAGWPSHGCHSTTTGVCNGEPKSPDQDMVDDHVCSQRLPLTKKAASRTRRQTSGKTRVRFQCAGDVGATGADLSSGECAGRTEGTRFSFMVADNGQANACWYIHYIGGVKLTHRLSKTFQDAPNAHTHVHKKAVVSRGTQVITRNSGLQQMYSHFSSVSAILMLLLFALHPAHESSSILCTKSLNYCVPS